MNYINIWTTANKYTYNFLKCTNSNFNNYNISEFIDYIISFKKIKISPLHFTKSSISGMTITNSKGTSLHYEKENPISRQNFTKCHELGHILLNHHGNIFLESTKNKKPIEKEADTFSASILMPDIVLINLIFYQNKHFQELLNTLNVSSEALNIRLEEWLNYYSDAPKSYIKKICSEYATRTNEKEIKDTIATFKGYIEANYNNFKIDPIQKFSYLIKKNHFITSKTFPELFNPRLQKHIKESFPNIKLWAYHNKGITLWYAWQTKIIPDKQAHQEAKTILLLLTS
ncbi:TPA: ImmA/IrrE family metallo-endopeptidase [Streptococcus agalactiae]|uniref:ImmA/IrrE family metallo-endopeptidase n=1 Tax=Streptococcus agalactiae TaxID=1311 RepID=UPI002AB9A734|nr:ImmA/IrrE family metallo-endopeptidase [Streptococcus agalactiae]HEN0586080.1 ImmA/IrrE family metallo-endopeptidase [Streptococcus agalactiae]HEN0679255.1 ImmA/IrrE family metallo-endopeptidase [Streptococcus agalactiae]HEN0765041.1 ImmA/IrrE family metallo-endopeptidase [Streptococcus agalactiae]